jgi:hypothetical protein
MTRLLAIATAVCTILSACAATQPPKPEPVPPELVPAGFSAAECRVVKPAEAITADGPGGTKTTMGMRSPEVSCEHANQSVVTTKSVPVCHTTGGKQLPLADCCMTESGDPIPACVPKLQPPE